ncbi:MAG: hypothetical protein AUH10_11915 [Gammaproteobacteria bacterium 13_2_20CM_66_19]|nr:MAG: hypothetical protein AUH10_11915 [Gammaproteobacteria bacterium 13_2_20CM_66_19]TLZ08724.1 MAG: hypothetical protein E6K28_08845 [Gammaproteobacteria bacterium]TLZ10071.1 MAG: hypothetical protein E6K39_03250 [Gammaproteobacteria bacterium]TLZ17861.1 MAG: hypothetical protein E6K26_10035 [Gammaproteobacteria bacterium]
MSHKHLGLAGVSAALALLAGCASGIPLHESDQEVRDRFNAYAGEPIDRLTWLGRFDSWQPVGRDELVVFTSPSDAYLLKVAQPCQNLQFANRIGVTSTAGSVSSRFDSVIVGQTPGWRDRCQIEEIRKVDYRRMKADMRLDAQRAREAKAEAKADN